MSLSTKQIQELAERVKKDFPFLLTTIRGVKSVIQCLDSMGLLRDGAGEEQEGYGCCCDLEEYEEGTLPDECVLDIGDIEGCIYAKKNKDKTKCKYWVKISEWKKAHPASSDSLPTVEDVQKVYEETKPPTAPASVVPDKPGWWMRRISTGYIPAWIYRANGKLQYRLADCDAKYFQIVEDDGLWGGPCQPPNEGKI